MNTRRGDWKTTVCVDRIDPFDAVRWRTECTREIFFVEARKAAEGDALHRLGGLPQLSAEKIRGDAGVIHE